MKNVAVYPGTFDPITWGHIDLIQRASKLFERVIIAIAESVHKKTLFSLQERVELTAQVLQGQANVEVLSFKGLLLNFAKAHQANILLRGLRTVTDFDYEFQLASMNRNLEPSIETLFLMPAEKYMYISATLVREIALLGGNVESFAPPLVVAALKKRFEVKNGTQDNR